MDEKPSTRKIPEFCSLRYGLALIMHFSNFTVITQRVSLSIAIIAMVNSTQQPGLFNASTERPLAFTLNRSNRSTKEFNSGASVYEWSPETQGIIFSSISYGIILTLIPSGYLAGIFGAKQMLGAGLLISSLLTLFTPLAADFGVILVIVIRTVQGMAQGMAWTGQFTIWAKWAPPLERSKLTSIAGSGAAFGSFIILCVGGLISQALGWPFIFYIFGSIGCVCCLLWFMVIYDDPMHHPCISVREKDHIVSSLAQQSSSPRRSVPIKAMVRCLPLWAIFTGFFSHFWLCTIIITYLPTYISSVLHVNIRDSGVLSSLPFIAASSCTILGGQLADFLLSRNLLRLITVRKLFSSLGMQVSSWESQGDLGSSQESSLPLPPDSLSVRILCLDGGMSFSLLLLSTCLAWFFTSHLDKQKSSTGPKRGLLPISEDIVADLNVVLTINFFNIFYLLSFSFHILGHRLSSSQFRLHVRFPWGVSKIYR
ncbi:sodium-dependent phosphate transport protein 3 isoform X1 [Balaenoptera ricei]|uniref:sodium-dependent phosphate transport protein 3 isoform X1 n=1 Tax=Balaenoptera ricei TaxID=2746895 RepID=UPI0028BD2065|nr:sodium-dependent phosphate transport protein 3 isoform X1 [Balaenoptera ricei]